MIISICCKTDDMEKFRKKDLAEIIPCRVLFLKMGLAVLNIFNQLYRIYVLDQSSKLKEERSKN